LQILQKNFLGTPLTTYKKFLTPYTLLTYSPTQLSEMQRQELELVGDIGKHSQSQRNYEQNLAEMTPELWRVSDCEEIVGGNSHVMMGWFYKNWRLIHFFHKFPL